jgi:hypothetical protein
MFVVRSAAFVRMTVQRYLKRPLHVFVFVVPMFVVPMIERGVHGDCSPLNERKGKYECQGRRRPSTPSHASIVREGSEPVKPEPRDWLTPSARRSVSVSSGHGIP